MQKRRDLFTQSRPLKEITRLFCMQNNHSPRLTPALARISYETSTSRNSGSPEGVVHALEIHEVKTN